MRLWTRLNIVLLAAFLAVLLYLVLLLSLGARVLPWSTGAQSTDSTVQTVQSVASSEVVALFGVDYKNLDKWAQHVLDGATGSFHDELQAKVENTKALVFQGKVVSTVTIRQVGVTDLQSSHAVLLVAADLTEKGDAIASQPASGNCPAASACHQYVLKVQVDKVGSAWKVSNLQVAS